MLQDKETIKTWHQDRGFGFIKPDAGDKDVFVHIRDFGNIERIPRIGDRDGIPCEDQWCGKKAYRDWQAGLDKGLGM